MKPQASDDILATLQDIQRRLRKLETAERPAGATLDGSGTAGYVAAWTGASTLGTAGYAGTAVVLTSGDQTIAGVKTLTSQARVATTGFTTSTITTPLTVIGDTNNVGLFSGSVAPGVAIVNRATSGDSVARLAFNARDGLVYGYFIADRAGAGLASDALSQAGIGVVARTNHPLMFVTNNLDRMRVLADGNVGIGVTAPTGQLHIDQSSSTGAKPVLVLDQADVSEEFIEFVATSGTANINPLSTTALGAYAGRFRVNINGTYRWVPFYADS